VLMEVSTTERSDDRRVATYGSIWPRLGANLEVLLSLQKADRARPTPVDIVLALSLDTESTSFKVKERHVRCVVQS